VKRTLVAALLLAGCGSSTTAQDVRSAPPAPPAKDPGSVYGPLEVGADYATYRKVTDAPYLSLVHGNRWVHVYVNELGADAYLDGSEMPVGSIVVKTSVEGDEHGQPTLVPGPLYVMEKRAPGFAPDHGDWFFAIHWADPTPPMRKSLGGPIYWRTPSPRADYCSDCHDGYDRGLGGLTPSSQLPR
jgi:hypothetical protein